MVNFPIEIIGNILSWVGASQYVVVASFIARRGIENHLHTLTINLNDCPGYKITRSRLELDIGKNAENLEIVEVSKFTSYQSDFHHMIVKSSKARRMSLCRIMLEHYNGEALQRGLLGHCQLENVVELKLRWEVIGDVLSLGGGIT
ncbi:hypothetical protein CQW23_24464 [Capsicum baccatum]|uniref:F-box domain-containing protein n=1 Tax=Capsicum baccatum TaxID=33114 RepID=A0A2G2VUX7_CAPBA|nr:hypothetical protein CQW23_24464 [Capsicum baccatum]